MLTHHTSGVNFSVLSPAPAWRRTREVAAHTPGMKRRRRAPVGGRRFRVTSEGGSRLLAVLLPNSFGGVRIPGPAQGRVQPSSVAHVALAILLIVVISLLFLLCLLFLVLKFTGTPATRR